MAKVIAIVDSNTGALVDVAGNTREGARYRRFAKRMLSIGENPTVLDYGANGATKLEVSDGGYAGEEISLKADAVKVSGTTFTVGGKKLEDIILSVIEEAESDSDVFVRKEDLANAISGISFDEGDTLETVKEKLNGLLDSISSILETN